MTRNGAATVRYRDLFSDREFGGLFCAGTISGIGSQLGKVALAALVYDRTNSPALAAATFAITYLPGLLGGPLLGTLADRLPRRALLATCDLLRALLMLAIATLPIGIVGSLALLLLIEIIRVPFGAARMAILADILDGDRFLAGNALVAASRQAVQVLGFGMGGFVVLLTGARTALAINTVTYLLSALILVALVRRRQAPTAQASDARESPGRPRRPGGALAGLRILRRTRRMPTLFWLLFLGPTALGAAEGTALPYGHELGGGETLGGLILAAAPLGSVLGLSWYGRMSTPLRERRLLPCSVTVGAGVAAAGFGPLLGPPGIPVVLLALFAAGFAMGHMAHLQASIVQLTPSDLRGRVIALANVVLQAGQAVAILLAGLAAGLASPGPVLIGVGASAATGAVLISVFGAGYAGRHRAERRVPTRRSAARPTRARPVMAGGVRPTPLPGRTPPSPFRR